MTEGWEVQTYSRHSGVMSILLGKNSVPVYGEKTSAWIRFDGKNKKAPARICKKISPETEVEDEKKRKERWSNAANQN